ncbi:MAG: LTA synthase family protein, partial [Bacteroidia bacterium]
MSNSSAIPSSLRKIIKVYLLGLGIFTLFRGLLFLNELNRIGETEDIQTILKAFVMGARFDTVILSYILALPFLLLTVGLFIPKLSKGFSSFSKIFIILLSSVAFCISAADIPYFKHFFSRLSITALEWMDSPSFVFGMIAGEPIYWLFVIPSIVIIFFYSRSVIRIINKPDFKSSLVSKILFSLLGAALLFGGIRGRLAHKSPIRVGTAYFSQSAYLNQLGLNPSFTFLKSYLLSQKAENKRIQLMEDKVAISLAQQYLSITDPIQNSITREVHADSIISPMKNVVLILMESMSASKMTRHGHQDNLTPFLDSLSYRGAYYPNAYSAGIHTFNGIFSSIFSLP